MSLIRSKDTKPEMAVRRMVHKMGFRYRLHSNKLPGTPDLIFSSRKKVVFIHGCFWHLHKGCKIYQLPKSNKNFWFPKLTENRRRDLKNQRALKKLGWNYLIVWECNLKNQDKLANKLKFFLEMSNEVC